MIEREWIDVEGWNLRHMKPGARVIEASWGAVELDARGAVIRVAGRWVTGHQLKQNRDPDTGEVLGPQTLEETAFQGEPPTREVVLAHDNYEDRAEWPLEEGDADREVPQAKPSIPAGGERKTAETTHVEPHDREVLLEKVDDSGEMGAPVDMATLAAAAEQAASQPEAEGYLSPFSDAPPAETSASDPAHNPPEGAPAGEAVEDLVQSGAAEVLDPEGSRAWGLKRFRRNT